MMPSAKRTKAKGPAAGRSASAACAELWISVAPLACSVAAVVTMMARPTSTATPMPTAVSSSMRFSAAGACSGAFNKGFRRGSTRWSSTSWADCQNSR